MEDVVHVGGRRYGSADSGVSYRAVADHARAISFLIAEGLRPGNGDREYVLRRLIRRATRHARWIEPGSIVHVLRSACEGVVEVMGATYPELARGKETIAQVIG